MCLVCLAFTVCSGSVSCFSGLVSSFSWCPCLGAFLGQALVWVLCVSRFCECLCFVVVSFSVFCFRAGLVVAVLVVVVLEASGFCACPGLTDVCVLCFFSLVCLGFADTISSITRSVFAYQSDRFVGDVTGGAVVGSIGEVYSADTARLY